MLLIAVTPRNIEFRRAATKLEPENLKVRSLLHSRVSKLERTRGTCYTQGGLDLVRPLQELSNLKASDDRDKVYGVLSLAKRG